MSEHLPLPEGIFFENQDSLELKCTDLLNSLKDDIVEGDPILQACEALDNLNVLDNPQDFMKNYNYIAENNFGRYDTLLEKITRRAFEQSFVNLYNRSLVETTRDGAEYIASGEEGILLTSRPYRPEEIDSVEKYIDVQINDNPLLSNLFQDIPGDIKEKILLDVRVYYVNRNEDYQGGRGGINSQGIPFVVNQENTDSGIVLWNETAHIIFNRLLAQFKIHNISQNSFSITLDGRKVHLIEISEYLSDISSFGYDSDMVSRVLTRETALQPTYLFSNSRFELAQSMTPEEQRQFFEADFRNILNLMLEKLAS